jgi:hypothetical protein
MAGSGSCLAEPCHVLRSGGLHAQARLFFVFVYLTAASALI